MGPFNSQFNCISVNETGCPAQSPTDCNSEILLFTQEDTYKNQTSCEYGGNFPERSTSSLQSHVIINTWNNIGSLQSKNT